MRLGVYHVQALLGIVPWDGRGYRARDTRCLERDVAIKLPPGGVSSQARIGSAPSSASTLNHPHIAAIYGVEERDGVQGLVLEPVGRAPLGTAVARVTHAPPGLPVGGTRLEYARHLARALEAAHAKGIIHRDLQAGKHQDYAGMQDPKLLDFGIAKTITGDSPTHALTATATSPPLTRLMQARLLLRPCSCSRHAEKALVQIGLTSGHSGAVVYEMLTLPLPSLQSRDAPRDARRGVRRGARLRVVALLTPASIGTSLRELPRGASGSTPPRHRVSPPSDRRQVWRGGRAGPSATGPQPPWRLSSSRRRRWLSEPGTTAAWSGRNGFSDRFADSAG